MTGDSQNTDAGASLDRRHEGYERAFERVRSQVWDLKSVDEMPKVVRALKEAVDIVGLRYHVVGINFIDQTTSEPTVRFYYGYERPFYEPSSEHERELVLSMWRAKETIYRRDIVHDDELGEVKNFEVDSAYPEGPPRSILDVPFSHGTLGINSFEPDAFRGEDISFLEDLARFVGEGFSRLDDLRRLEDRTRELEQQIHERRELEKRMRQTQKMEALGRMSAGIAHNFNNRLTVILTALERSILKGRHDPELLERGRSATEQASQMVEQLLLFARDGHTTTLLPVSLAEVLESAVRMCTSTFDHSVTVQSEIDADLPVIMADATQIEQVIANLLINARDAVADCPHGTILVTSGRVEATPPADEAVAISCVRIGVSDNGPGMDADTVERIFEPFFTTKEPGKGTGLGLSTSYAIVDEHRGWIECDSRPSEGTAFSVFLPVPE